MYDCQTRYDNEYVYYSMKQLTDIYYAASKIYTGTLKKVQNKLHNYYY